MLQPKYLLILSTDPAETYYNIKVDISCKIKQLKNSIINFDNVTTPEQGKAFA